ncbi:MAG: hypothetical protein QNJ46_35735 [Leptolyngbyaceae cyanobacterium MO_188.B28]|nr:hypothetical protein [Leptolyngbyaceae cyanobacterium MO_188.B28]
MNTISIANGSLVTVDINLTSIFSTNATQVFANSDTVIGLTADGERFFGKVAVLSQLIGHFDMIGGQAFSEESLPVSGQSDYSI